MCGVLVDELAAHVGHFEKLRHLAGDGEHVDELGEHLRAGADTRPVVALVPLADGLRGVVLGPTGAGGVEVAGGEVLVERVHERFGSFDTVVTALALSVAEASVVAGSSSLSPHAVSTKVAAASATSAAVRKVAMRGCLSERRAHLVLGQPVVGEVVAVRRPGLAGP